MAAENTVAELQVLICVALEKLDRDLAEAKAKVANAKKDMDKPGGGGLFGGGLVGGLAKGIAAVKSLESVFRLVTAAVKLADGDVQGFINNLKRLPAIGSFVDAWWEMSLAISGAGRELAKLEEQERRMLADAAEGAKRNALIRAATGGLDKIAQATRRENMAFGEDERTRVITDYLNRRADLEKQAQDAIDKLGGEGKPGTGAIRTSLERAIDEEVIRKNQRLQEITNKEARANADLLIDIEIEKAKAAGDNLKAQELEVRRAYANMRKDATDQQREMLRELEELKVEALRREDKIRKDQRLQEITNKEARANADLLIDIEIEKAKAVGNSLRAQELEVRRTYANMRRDATDQQKEMLRELEELKIEALRREDKIRKDEQAKRDKAEADRAAKEKKRIADAEAEKKRKQKSDVIAATAVLQQKALEAMGRDVEARIVGINEQYRTQIEAAEKDGNARLAAILKQTRDLDIAQAKDGPGKTLRFQQFEAGRMSFGVQAKADPSVELQKQALNVLKSIAKNTGKPNQAIAA